MKLDNNEVTRWWVRQMKHYDAYALEYAALNHDSIEAIYVYGSRANGYNKYGSDIDIVALTSSDYEKKPFESHAGISVHLVHPVIFEFYEDSCAFASLKMVPLYNTEKCEQISDDIKSELVRRQLITFKKNGIRQVRLLDPIRNFLLCYGVCNPWRIKHIKRIFASRATDNILTNEYKRIFGLLVDKNMLLSNNGGYVINEDYVFDDKYVIGKGDSIFSKAKQSFFGWHYAANAFGLADFMLKRIRSPVFS